MSPGAGRWRTLSRPTSSCPFFCPFPGGLQVSFPDGGSGSPVAAAGATMGLFRRRSGSGCRLPPLFGYDLPGGLDRRQRLMSQRAEAQCRRWSIYELLRTYPIANGYRRITSDKPDSLVA